jgi:hypothetical protein
VNIATPGYLGSAMFVGACTSCTLVPFTMVFDRRSKALAIDHTMPPSSYHQAWADKRRRADWAATVLTRLSEGRL